MNAGLPLRDEHEALVVPDSAIVYDILGGSWVYESLGDHKYSRRRVQVKYVIDKTAVLANGPPDGSKIVSEGAAELRSETMSGVKQTDAHEALAEKQGGARQGNGAVSQTPDCPPETPFDSPAPIPLRHVKGS